MSRFSPPEGVLLSATVGMLLTLYRVIKLLSVVTNGIFLHFICSIFVSDRNHEAATHRYSLSTPHSSEITPHLSPFPSSYQILWKMHYTALLIRSNRATSGDLP